MLAIPWLSIVTFLPLLGALLVLLGPKNDETARHIAFWTSLLTLAVSLLILFGFDPANTGFQFVEEAKWLSFGKISILYKKGVDGLSIWFVVASAFLMPICFLAAWEPIKEKVREFMIALLILETMMIGMFCSLDFILFYIFFEGVLLPMFLIIGIWGGPGRVHASYRFFLYTLLGSVLMLLAIIAMCVFTGTTDMTVALKTDFPKSWQNWLWLAFLASFAVKTPMWPVHTWLPYAHVEAPTTGSVILAGILLKMGGYGFIRLSLQMLPQASETFTVLMYVLSGIAIVATSLTALVQTDMKRLIAYSSVAHMGYVTMGTFTKNQQGLEGAVMVMLSHTLVSSALFLVVGVLYDRLHSREISRYGGVVNNMPHFAMYAMLFTLASVGLPGTSGFIGEFLSMQGAFLANTWMAAVAGLGVILGAAYMLWLYRRVFFGPLTKPDVKEMTDLTWKEYAALAPLAVLVLVMGIQPGVFKDVISPTMKAIADTAHARIAGGVP
ncbi:MAG: NADH-quinone oxidoreductase subunit M [Proteobacteria bacterium]|nr:NADH-quinone oxidoreductase subunit M [Pseudomonadota bacterium]